MSGREQSRRVVGAAAVLISILAGLAGSLLGGSGAFVFGGVALVIVTMLAIPYPSLIAGQVVLGATLAASLLLSDGVEPFAVLPLVVGIVAGAELLALAARQDKRLASAEEGELGRVAGAVVIAGVVFSGVHWLGGLPGPRGLLAIALASGACVMLSLVLVGSGPSRHPSDQDTSNLERRWG